MVDSGTTLVVGVGEVGSALAEVLAPHYQVACLDIKPAEIETPVNVMHICFPFLSGAQFHTAARGYIRRFRPAVVVINSTVPPGTTRMLAQSTRARVAYSPVRGKHVRMVQDLKRYTKFVSALDPFASEIAESHFAGAGLKTASVEAPETLELAKLAETTYFGVIIAFAQELDRYARAAAADYDEIQRFFTEIDFLPQQKYFPGVIGGHCVIPNIRLLLRFARSDILEAVLRSNDLRVTELRAGERPGTQAN